MAIKFEKIRPGMVLYDRHKERMGNTMLRTIGEWPVAIVSVDTQNRTARVSWNGNGEQTYTARRLEGLSTWSMNDADVEVTRGRLTGQVTRVRRLTKKERAAK